MHHKARNIRAPDSFFHAEREIKGEKGGKDHQSLLFPSSPASVTAATVDGDSSANCLARGVRLGLGLGDGDSLALDFRPREND